MEFTLPSEPNVVIVGAGPAGLGVAMALRAAGVENYVILDAKGVGAAFERWPAQMRMITPSFYSNPFNQPDLNAIDPDTSPGVFLKTAHPTGKQYAKYLLGVAGHFGLPVWAGPRVLSLEKNGGSFTVKTTECDIAATFVVWAAGQFFYPNHDEFPGSELCRHNSKIEDWAALEGDEFTVIGGYESGIDAAVNLCELGKSVHLLSRGEPWAEDSPDPSRSLSLRTRERLREVLADTTGRRGALHFYKNADIRAVEKIHEHWVLKDQDGIPFATRTQPILATGFIGSLGLVAEHFAFDGPHPVFSEACDESTVSPGLFYSGADLRHRNSMFCFIYKFRSRFGLIAREIAARLGLPEVEAKLELHRKNGFMNEDLACCASCECAVTDGEEKGVPARDFKQRAVAAAELIEA